VVGLLVVTWARYAFYLAAHGGAGDVDGAGRSIIGTIGMLVGLGFIYVAWRTSFPESGDE